MAHALVPALAVAMAALVLWAGIARWNARARRDMMGLERAWAAYAAIRGMQLTTYAELAGSPGEIGPPLVQGEVQGLAVEICLVSASTRPSTRVEATLPGVSRDFVMVIRRRGDRVDRALAGRALAQATTGNKVFDAAYVLLTSEPDLARSLLDRRLAHVVLGFPRAATELGAWDNRFVLAWRGMETDAVVLDAAIQVVFTACRRRA